MAEIVDFSRISSLWTRASELIKELNYLIVNTPTLNSDNEGHFNRNEAFQLKEQLNIQNLIFTHINHATLTPEALDKKFSNYPVVNLAYDGLELKI